MLNSTCKQSQSAGQSTELPNVFCWTKMGAEAGQELDVIIKRKELERIAGEGVFAWGIGSSLGKAPTIARQTSKHEVEVFFTPMKSAAKEIDAAPSEVLIWTSYYDASGTLKNLPNHIVITSRGGVGKKAHYALICYSEHSLLDQQVELAFSAKHVCNFTTGNPVGASQVTSLVKIAEQPQTTMPDYNVKFRAKFYADGFVKLAHPVVMTTDMMLMYSRLNTAESTGTWLQLAKLIRKQATESINYHAPAQAQLALC